MLIRDFETMEIRADQIVDFEPPTPLFLGCYRGIVTLLNGESGAGKSTLAYYIALHAATGTPLWGYDWGGRPLNVYYVDPENGAVRGNRVHEIGLGTPNNLTFNRLSIGSLSDSSVAECLRATVTSRGIDLLIIDTLSSVLGVNDENDNAEAARHMAFLSQLAAEADCSVLLLHHIGKFGLEERRMSSRSQGRGASAWYCNSRATLELSTNDEEGESKQFLLKIIKSMMGGRGNGVHLKSAGQHSFEQVTPEDVKQANDRRPKRGRPDKHPQAAQIILSLLDSGEKSRTAILEALAKEKIGRSIADKVLEELLASNHIIRREKGVSFIYARVLPEAEQE